MMNKYEVGQKWKMRNGCVAEVQKVTEYSEAWASFTDSDGFPRLSNFLQDGSYLPGGTENQLDLVGMVVSEVQSKEHSPLPWRFSEERCGYQILDAKSETVTLDTNYYPVAPDRETCEFIIAACNSHAVLVEALKLVVRYRDYIPSEPYEKAVEALTAAGVK